MSLLRGTIYLFAAEVVFTLSGYLLSALLGRVLGPAEYGRYSLVVGLTTMIVILLSRALPMAMSKHISADLDDRETVLAVKKTAAAWQTLIVASATILFFFLAPVLADIFNDPSLTSLFRLSALIIPAFALSSFHAVYFNALRRFGAAAILKISRGLFRLLWIVSLAIAFQTAGAVAGAAIAPLSVFAVALVLDIYLNRDLRLLRRRRKIPFYPAGKLFRFAGVFSLYLLCYEFFTRTDIYLIKAVLGDDRALGLYAAAMTLAMIPYYLSVSLSLMLFPTISGLVGKDDPAAKRLLEKVLRFVFFLTVPAAAGLIFFAEPLSVLFFGRDFAGAAEILPLLVGGTVFGTIFAVAAAALGGGGRVFLTAAIAAGGIALTVPADLFLLPLYGVQAAAVVFSAVSILMGLASLAAIASVFGARPGLVSLLRLFFAGGIMYFVLSFFPSTLGGLLPGGLAGLAAYLSILRLSGEELLSSEFWRTGRKNQPENPQK
ncbi:MAG TPA: hypothetical protein ENJ77_00825 [Candidatus Moranbacteria bacterium]|nr:hypothetical protein [Candidatus Moranbacteria bacterium]